LIFHFDLDVDCVLEQYMGEISFAAPIGEIPVHCAHHLFEIEAASRPDSTALMFSGDQVSYSRLNGWANGIADELVIRGIGKGDVVGLCMRSSPALIAALLGIFKAGAAFLPLDPAFPQERLDFMIRDAGSTILMTTEDLAARPEAPFTHAYRNLEERQRNRSQGARFGVMKVPESAPRGLVSGRSPDAARLECATLDDVACIIYTSGSTGRPKGAIRTHRGIVARLAWARPEEDDILCHNMSICYGFSQERLLVPLMCGAPLAVMPDEAGKDAARFVEAIARAGVTEVTLVPLSLGRLLALGRDALAKLRSLRRLAVGGAALTLDLAQRFARALPHVKLINAYGTVESGSVIRGEIFGTSGRVTLGKPVAGADVHILDDSMSPVPVGEDGEIYIAGPCIARGYLNQPKLTAERFVPNPFSIGTISESWYSRLYRTGDLGRWVGNGEIEVRGRVDRQVKIRGFRVELDEVEEALLLWGGVAEAHVLCERGGGQRLVAYVGGVGLVGSELRRALQSHLPSYMLPAAFVVLPTLPRLLNGKVDTRNLPEPPQVRPALGNPYVTPRNPLEESIADIWAELLGIDSIGVEDHFLDLGGDSLLAERVVAEIEESLGLRGSSTSLFDYPTIAELAVALTTSEAKATGDLNS
jgi:amino acid adenylation domain-containing protein